MHRFVACLMFLIGFPLLFAGGVLGLEYALWRLRPELFATGTDPLTQLLAGHIRPLVAGVTFAVMGCGIYDMVDMFGGLSDYRKGMRGYLPKGNPMGFVLLRARRYVLVLVVAAATFVAFNFAESVKSLRDVPAGAGGRLHLWFAAVAFFTARRPLNSPPLVAFLTGTAATITLAGDMAGAFATGESPPKRSNDR